MQKVQNVIKVCLVILLFSVIKLSAQQKISGKYSIIDGTGFFFSNYSFNKKGIFTFEEGGDLGISSYSKGHYSIERDSLILNYDLTELRVNDYHKYRYYQNNKDSIKVKINLFDMKKKPIKGNAVAVISERIVKYSNKNGFLEFNFKKEKKQLEFNVASTDFGYDFSIWKNRNYEIDIYLNLDNYATAIKNQILKYKILEQTEDFIKLKNYNSVMKLIKQPN